MFDSFEFLNYYRNFKKILLTCRRAKKQKSVSEDRQSRWTIQGVHFLCQKIPFVYDFHDCPDNYGSYCRQPIYFQSKYIINYIGTLKRMFDDRCWHFHDYSIDETRKCEFFAKFDEIPSKPRIFEIFSRKFIMHFVVR